MRPRPPERRQEPTIALINVVFLMLVFFLVAGSLAPPLDPELSLIETKTLEGREPPDALVLHPDGRITYRGEHVADAAAYLARRVDLAEGPVRLVPDKAASASSLVDLVQALRAAGAQSVRIVTARALQ